MSRNKITIVIVLACIAAFAFWFQSGKKGDPKDKETATVVEKTINTPKAPKAEGKRESRPAEVEVLFADDPEGDLRLEGQVVTKDELAVAGAIVSIDSRPPRITKSEEDGSFFFDKLVGKSYDLVARSTEGVAGPITARLSESNEPVMMVLSEGARVSVQVVSSDKPDGLVGALVELRGIDMQSATTDKNGNAEFRQVPVDRYRVVANAEGYAPGRTRVSISRSGATATARLELKGGARVAGVVVDPNGKPLAGARVVYRGLSDRSLRADHRLDAVVSDKAGQFAIPALSAGSFVFTATAEGFAPGSSESIDLNGRVEKTGVEVRMEPGATLQGKVVNTAGKPVPGARVRVSVKTEGMRRRGRRGGVRQIFTDDEGAYELTGLPRKAHDVVAVHDNASSEIHGASLGDDPFEVELNITLDVDGLISGIVVDTSGEPLPGAQVSLFPDFRKGARRSGSEWRLRGMSTALADSGGRFEIGGLKADEDYRVRATPATSTSRGRAWLTEGVEARTGDTEVKVVLPADGGIKGKVSFANGDAPGMFTVSVGWRRGTPFSSKDGSFELGELPPQKFTATIQGPSFDPRRIEVEIKEGKITDLGSVTVSQGRRVVGRVVDSSGSAVEGAVVSAGRMVTGDGSGTSTGQGRGHPLARETKRATTDENGDFAISGIGLGDMNIVADHETVGRSIPTTVQMSNESITALTLTILKVGSLTGTVRRSGTLEPDVSVTATSIKAPSVAFSVATGPDGSYRFDRLAPDSYRVKAMAGGSPMRGMSFYSALVDVPPDTKATLDIDLDAGGTTLNVALTADEELNFSRLTILGGAVQAATARELEAIVGAGTGFEGFGMSIRGQPAQAKGLSAGQYSVCATVYPPQVTGMGGVMDYMKREGDNLNVQCEMVTIADAAEQNMTMKVVVPVFVPDPSGGEEGGEQESG